MSDQHIKYTQLIQDEKRKGGRQKKSVNKQQRGHMQKEWNNRLKSKYINNHIKCKLSKYHNSEVQIVRMDKKLGKNVILSIKCTLNMNIQID